ncbi:AAA family ATPase [Stigmatella hybrida]|uniref:AAA family ATPase n=1 Tax=Stigmatella hybrida TaxID=394097 RepID=UPI001CDB02FC|nr:AAA family ATPase [Stigmatella hybrida]
MAKLTKLSIKTFRNVAPTTLEFRPGVNIVLGKNAAGKTTLLRLLSTITGATEEGLPNDVLEVNYSASGGPLDLDHSILRTRVEKSAALFNESNYLRLEAPNDLHQVDSFVFKNAGTIFAQGQVLPNEVTFTSKEKQLKSNRLPRISPPIALAFALAEATQESGLDPSTAITIFKAFLLGTGRMDESLEYWKTLLSLSIKIDDTNFDSTLRFYEYPSAFTKSLPKPSFSGSSVTLSLEFLTRVARILGYDSATARFDVEHLNIGTEQQAIRLSNLRFFFKRLGEEISHSFLSYGQKRLLSFFAYAASSPIVLIADELVNGLHHEWISACLTEIGDRQAFLTSQNPLLLDFLRFDSAEEVRRAFILCERTSNEAGSQLIWRNPSEEEADSFFSAYQTGIQRVSDILFTKGLW